MTKYINYWGVKQPEPVSPMSEEWQSAPTLLGGADPKAPDIQTAAAGDLRCEGIRGGCSNGGSRESTAAYSITGRKLCAECGIKAIGVSGLPHSEQMDMLIPFLLRPN